MSGPVEDASAAALRPERAPGGRRRLLWWSSAACVALAGTLLAATHRRELRAVLHLLGQVETDRLVLAAVLETVSFLSLAALELWLLRAAGARSRLGTVTALAAGANAMAGVMPAGGVLSLGWVVRQLQRRGVAFTAAAASLAVAGAVSLTVLGVLLVAGALLADPSGPAPGLRESVLVGAAAFAAFALLIGLLSLSSALRRATARAWRRLGAARPALARAEASLADVVRAAASLQPDPQKWTRPFLLSGLNWLGDAAALALCLLSLDAHVPWRGLLLAYTLTQLFSSLRITPGSLGVTEASLTALLVLYGVPADQAIAATLLYRGLSFWLLQPIGWTCWLVVTLRGRSRDSADGTP